MTEINPFQKEFHLIYTSVKLHDKRVQTQGILHAPSLVMGKEEKKASLKRWNIVLNRNHIFSKRGHQEVLLHHYDRARKHQALESLGATQSPTTHSIAAFQAEPRG